MCRAESMQQSVELLVKFMKDPAKTVEPSSRQRSSLH